MYTGKIWLVTELCTGGDLSTRKLNEHSAKNVIEQILRALVYLHRLGVVHRDLKLENVLYESSAKDASIRLIDFGLSRAFDRTSVLNDYSRTPYTMTPEAVEGKNMEDLHTDKADMWAVGVIAFVLLSGNFPFVKNTADLKDKSKLEILKQVRANELEYFHLGVGTYSSFCKYIFLHSGEFAFRCDLERTRYYIASERICNRMLAEGSRKKMVRKAGIGESTGRSDRHVMLILM